MINEIDFNNRNNNSKNQSFFFINDNKTELQYISFTHDSDSELNEGYKMTKFNSNFSVMKVIPLDKMLYRVFSKSVNGNIYYVNFDSLKSYIIPLDSMAIDSLNNKIIKENILYFFNFCYSYDGYGINRKRYNKDYFFSNSFFYNQFYYYVSDNNYSIIEFDVVNKKVRIIYFNFKETNLGKYKDCKIIGFYKHQMVLYNRFRKSIVLYDLIENKWERINVDLIYSNVDKKFQEYRYSFYITSNNIYFDFIDKNEISYIYKIRFID
jgi:hypothetical protein